MVELQIVILAVAGSSPVGHPFDFGLRISDRGKRNSPPGVARALLKKSTMLIPASPIESSETKPRRTDFWLRLLQDEELRDCDNLQKLLIGCEIIAALDGVDLLAA